MIFAVNSYGGYEHSGDNKLLSSHETLDQALSLEHLGLVAVVPHEGETQLGAYSDMNRDAAREGFVAEFTQGGVLVDPTTRKARVVAFTLDIAGQDGSDEIWLSDSDVLRKSEEVVLDPKNKLNFAEEDYELSRQMLEEDDPKEVVSIAGIAMPAMKKLLVVQMVPEDTAGTA